MKSSRLRLSPLVIRTSSIVISPVRRSAAPRSAPRRHHRPCAGGAMIGRYQGEDSPRIRHRRPCAGGAMIGRYSRHPIPSHSLSCRPVCAERHLPENLAAHPRLLGSCGAALHDVESPSNGGQVRKQAMNKYMWNFLAILAAGLVSAVLGGLFGAGIALLSPEFVSGLFRPEPGDLVRYAAAVGAIWGLFVGAGAMAFVIAVAAIANWFRPKSRTDGE